MINFPYLNKVALGLYGVNINKISFKNGNVLDFRYDNILIMD